MPDRDKVIAGLEFCLAHDFCWSMKYKCPWVDECRKDYKSLKRAAIELLKEDGRTDNERKTKPEEGQRID